MWPSSYFSNLVEEQLDSSNHAYPYKNVIFRNTGHAVGLTPYLPTSRGQAQFHPVDKGFYKMGGLPKDIAETSLAVQGEVKSFLDSL